MRKNKPVFEMCIRDRPLYEQSVSLKDGLAENDAAAASVDGLISTLETISKDAHAKTAFTYVPLEELKVYKQMSA